MNGIDKWDPLVDLAKEYSDGQQEKNAVRILKVAHTLAFQFSDTPKIVSSGRLLGRSLNRISKPEEASKLFLQIIPFAETTTDKDQNLMLIYNPLALSYTYLGLFDKALYYNFKSLAIREIIGDKESINIALNNIGLVYYNLDNFDKAIEYYLRSRRLKREMGSDYDLDRLWINLSLCYRYKDQLDIAQKCLDSAFANCKDNCSTVTMITGEYSRGVVYDGEGKYSDAEKCFFRSYDLSVQTGDIRYQLDNLIMLSRLSLKKRSFVKAVEYLQTAEKLSQSSKFSRSELEMWRLYSEVYNSFKDYRSLSISQVKYIHLRDSLFGEALTQNLMAIQTEYEQRDNKAKMVAQNKELLLKEEIIDRQKILTSVAGIAILILGLLIFVLYQTNQHKKSVNIVLEQKVIERSQELEASYEAIQKAYDDERRFIHETMGDAKIQLSNIRNFSLSVLKEVSSEQVVQYMGQLYNTTNELRAIMERLTKEVNT